MFKKIQNRLLLSYLLVLFIILGGFSVAVRVIFSRNLFNHLVQELTALGHGLASSAEYAEYREDAFQPIDKDGDIRNIITQKQGLQWFDSQGKSLEKQGNITLNLPLALKHKIQIQNHTLGVTVPIIDDDTNHLLGYVRVTESLENFYQTLHNLDLGLAGGILLALLLSGAGGVWLTRQAMQPIEKSFQRLQQFSADASHELRNPMMEIKSNASVALRYPVGMRLEDEERFQFIICAADQVTQLAEDLLFLARTDGNLHQKYEQINLALILTELIQKYESKAIAKSLKLNAKLSNKLYVVGDQLQLVRLFSNLIDNAIYYTPVGGTVEVIASRDSHLCIQVKDTGIGIAPEHLSQVFDRFWRADQSRTHWEGGSGLGLSIAQGIAKLHGGSIAVVSQLNQGSCFTVRLPSAN